MTEVVNVNNRAYDLYIGRGSIWGNPFVIGKDGTRDEVIEKYKKFVLHPDSYQLHHLHILYGRVLGCHCKPLRCHGDVLVELANRQLMFSLGE